MSHASRRRRERSRRRVALSLAAIAVWAQFCAECNAAQHDGCLCNNLGRMVVTNVCQMRQTTLDRFFKPQDVPAPPTLLGDAGEAGSDGEAAVVLL